MITNDTIDEWNAIPMLDMPLWEMEDRDLIKKEDELDYGGTPCVRPTLKGYWNIFIWLKNK